MSDEIYCSSFDENKSVRLIDQQNHGLEEHENDSEIDTQVYPLRWWIAAFFSIQTAVIRMIMNSFGIVNNIDKAYFDISYYAIDWFSLIQEVGIIVSSIFLALLSFNKITKFRKLFVMMVLMAILPCILLIISFAYPQLYALLYLGLFVVGFSFQTGVAISAALATNWFPENQIGTAMSFQLQGMAVGAFLAFLVPSQLATPPPQHFSHLQDDNMTSQLGNATFKMRFCNWKYETYWKFLLLYGCVMLVCVIVLVFTLMFVSDYPKKPPTVAQALVRTRNNYDQPQNIRHNFGNFINLSKLVLFDKVFVLAIIIRSITFSLNNLQRLLMGQILRDVFIVRSYGSSINAMSGYVLMVYEASSFFGNLVSGLLLDYFKIHKLILHFGQIATAFTIIGLVVGQHYSNVAVIFVFIALFGFTLSLCGIPIFDVVLEHTYPINPSFVILLFNTQCEILVVIISQISRFILNFINGTTVFIFMVVLIIMCVVLTAFLNPNYKRKEASNTDRSSTEEQQLLTDNTEEIEQSQQTADKN